jgi:hypothetical protein
MRRIGISWIRERRTGCAKRKLLMTSVGRNKLADAVTTAIGKTTEKYHLTRAEVVGVLMMCVAAHSQMRYRYEDDDEDDEKENED